MVSAVGLMVFLLSILGSSYALIPKCFQMKAEIYQLQLLLFSKSNVTTLADGVGFYDPECESNGLLKAKQCNNTDVCCWVRIEMKHKETSNPLNLLQLQRAIASAFQEQDNVDTTLDSTTEVKYDVDARLITMEVKKIPDGDKQNLHLLTYYMEKDVEVQSRFSDRMKFEPTVESEKLEIESIMVYYVDEKEPTNTMQTLTTGLLILTGVFILAACVGLLILFLIRSQKRGQYEKAQTSDMEEI